MKAYRASGTKGSFIDLSPRSAALGYFALFPGSRKCDVIEGERDGVFFTVAYGRRSEGKWPASWKDVTKKTATELPGQE